MSNPTTSLHLTLDEAHTISWALHHYKKHMIGLGRKEGWNNDVFVAHEKRAVEDISIERENQDIKWGDQSHLENFWWLTILAEEFGEVAKDSNQENSELLYEELTQVAAVAVAWMEALNKKKNQ